MPSRPSAPAPCLLTTLRGLADKGVDEGLLLLPLLVPMEPGLRVGVGRSVQRRRACRVEPAAP